VAIALEFIDFIVPIEVIRARYPGGWEQCLEVHSDFLGRSVWYDDHLFRDGAMSPSGIEALVKHWTRIGLEPLGILEGNRFWKDCCVTEHMFGGPTLPCSWIEITNDGKAAFLKGTKPGETIGRTRT